MADHVSLVLYLTYHFLEALQSCTTDAIQCWSQDTLRNILCFGEDFRKAMNKLDTTELSCLQEHISSIVTCFQQFSLDTLSYNPLTDCLSCLLEVLVANPYLSQGQRDVIFEFCLDAGIEVPKFPPMTHQTDHPLVEISSATHCRCFIAHLHILLSRSENVFLFLDSCLALDPDYLVCMVIRALEQVADPIGNAKLLEHHLIDWLIAAMDKDQTLRIRIAQQNSQRLRDLALVSPNFEDCLIRLFDEKYLSTMDDLTSLIPHLAHLLQCLSNSIPRWPELRRRVRQMVYSKSRNSHIWQELRVYVAEEDT